MAAAGDSPLVQAEHACDQAVELGGDLELPLAAAELALLGVAVAREPRLEGRLDLRHGAADLETARQRRGPPNAEAERFEHPRDLRNRLGVGAVIACQRVACERLGAGGLRKRAARERHGQLDPLVRAQLGDPLGIALARPLASGQWDVTGHRQLSSIVTASAAAGTPGAVNASSSVRAVASCMSTVAVRYP